MPVTPIMRYGYYYIAASFIAILVLCLALHSPVHLNLVLLICCLLNNAPVSITCVQTSSNNTDTCFASLLWKGKSWKQTAF